MTREEHWAGLQGGYRIPYDPRPALARLAAGDSAAAWDALWENLYHQGDVGEASYAAVPELVRIETERGAADWNGYALAVAVEQARGAGHNPPVPGWLRADYDRAWTQLTELALQAFPAASEPELVQSLFATLAIGKGWNSLARFATLAEDERQELLDRFDGTASA